MLHRGAHLRQELLLRWFGQMVLRKPGRSKYAASEACDDSEPAAAAATTAELRQSRQNSLLSVSVITMKPALSGGAGSQRRTRVAPSAVRCLWQGGRHGRGKPAR